MQKILTCLMAVLCLTIFFQSEAAAKSTAEFKNFVASEIDDETVRIEIEYKGSLREEDISAKVGRNSLYVYVDNSIPGRISKVSGVKNEAKNLVEKIVVGAVKKTQTRFQIVFSEDVDADSFKISLLPADKSEKKSARVAIDLKKSMPKFIPQNNLVGVNGRVIVLDAGHGGSDSGARGHYGTLEKDVTLSVALKAEKLLTDAGAKVIMTRTTDRDVSWSNSPNRTELQARVNKCPPETEIFISIHCNAFTNSATRGMETYYYSRSPQSRKLAVLLNEELAKFGGRFNRGVKTANFYVLTHNSHVASLVELAFLTNYDEEVLLADDGYQNVLARAIVSAVNRYFNE